MTSRRASAKGLTARVALCAHVLGLLAVLATALAVLIAAAPQVAAQDAPTGPVLVLRTEGAVGPAMSRYITRHLDFAAEAGAPLVVLQMDTPGGLDTSMREIIRAILASPVPVATWVAPSGARAASAGTYILYASHIAAMAPATNLGAATPIPIAGGGGDAEEPANPAEAKAVSDAVAYIRELAELRGRNADWAERAVREAVSLGANAAAEQDVIDFVASDLDDLLAQADGMTVRMAQGEVTLDTAGLDLDLVEPDWRTELLSVITNPNVALILMMIGVYGLILEFLNPGILIAGIVGGISLLLGLFSLALLPLDYTGLLLILLGLALIVAEVFAPSFGALGIGGTVALVLGAVMLVDTDVPGLEVSIPLIAAVGFAGLVLTLIAARLAARSFRAPVATGWEELIGAEARVIDWHETRGHVWLHGERWEAEGPPGLVPDERVRVVRISGLVLGVERLVQRGAAAPAH